MAHPDLLSPEAAAQARALEFFARTRVEGFLKGPNASPLKGQSTDFLRHRQYQHGDDLRHLDWRVYARSDRLVTREYEEYTNLDVMIAIDRSGSMGYRGLGFGKLEFARHWAAMLAYLFHLQKDRFGLALLDERIADCLRPGSGRKHLAETYRWLAELTTGGETDLAGALRQLQIQVRHKSVFILISDCYQEPEALTKALGTLRIQGHDVVLYQVVDPAEQDLDFPGFTIFRDLETGATDSADPVEIRQAYRQVVAEHGERLRAGCNRYGIELRVQPAVPDWDAALAHVLRLRSQRQ